MESEKRTSPAFPWRTVTLVVLVLAMTAFAAWAARRILHDRELTHRVIAYQIAYLQRMRDVEEQLDRYRAEFGEYPHSMEEWVRSNPDAAKLIEPVTNAAAPFDLRLELLSYPEKVLIAIEPGVHRGDDYPIYYLGSALFNTLPAGAGNYTDEDVARTRAAIEKLKQND